MPSSPPVQRAPKRVPDHRIDVLPGIRSRRGFVLGAAALAGLGLNGLRAYAQRFRRIVSTAPSITESLFVLGLGGQVVGVSKYCDYPAQVAALPRVGSYVKPDLEAIARLAPDLVVLERGLADATERLKALAIHFIEVPHGSLDDVFTAVSLIGREAGVPDRAAALVAEIKGSLEEIAQHARAMPPQRTLAIIDRKQGTLEALTAVGPNNYMNQMLGIAGGVNVLAKPGLPPYPHISLETVIREDPDVILDLSSLRASDAERKASLPGVLALWAQSPSLRAVRGHRVFFGTSGALLVPGPRAPQAAQILFHYMHDAPHAEQAGAGERVSCPRIANA